MPAQRWTLTPNLLRALQALQQSGGMLIQRAIPSTGEMLPVIGLGRGNDAPDHAELKEVLETLVDNGGRVVDTTHGGPGAEEHTGTMVKELGIQERLSARAARKCGGAASQTLIRRAPVRSYRSAVVRTQAPEIGANLVVQSKHRRLLSGSTATSTRKIE